MIALKKYRTDWEYKRLQFGASILNSNVDKKIVDDEIPVKLCNYVDVYYNDIINESLDFMEGSATEDEIEKFKIVSGDVIITKDSESADDIGIPAYVEKDLENVVCGYHLAVFKTFKDELNGKFLLYFLNSKVAQTNFELGANGVTRFGLGRNAIKTLPVPYPKYSEQLLIARFLDQKTGQIDRLIEQKEKLLRLLAEKRTAIITAAVTGKLSELGFSGLKDDGIDDDESKSSQSKIQTNPNSDKREMKDSGLDWLGEIPKEWEVSKVGYDYDVQLGKMVQPEPRNEDDEYLPYLRAANIHWLKPDLTSLKCMWFSPREKSKYNLQNGDLLISEGGDVGRSCIWSSDQEMYFQNALNRVRSVDKSDVEFLYYWMFFLKQNGYINIICNSSTIAHYTAEKVKATPFFRPNIQEQKAIVSKIRKSTKSIDKVVMSINISIQKLKEYREALITATVTGQIDVRKEVEDV